MYRGGRQTQTTASRPTVIQLRRGQMTRISSLTFALLILTAFGLQSASAQFRLPDIPRIKKPKVEVPRSGGGNDASADNTQVDDQEPNPRAPADYNANLN